MNGPRKVHPMMDTELIELIREYNNDDALIELMNRYQPLIKSMSSRYYVRGMDFEDWEQEAALILIKICRSYDPSRRNNFGAYYRRCLRNRFYDFIRRQNAKKRIPNNYLISYSVNQAYYDDFFVDMKATHPEHLILMTENLQKLMRHCSKLEKQVIIGLVVNHQSFSEVAKRNHCSVSKVKNAFERCCRKYHRMRNRGRN